MQELTKYLMPLTRAHVIVAVLSLALFVAAMALIDSRDPYVLVALTFAFAFFPRRWIAERMDRTRSHASA